MTDSNNYFKKSPYVDLDYIDSVKNNDTNDIDCDQSIDSNDIVLSYPTEENVTEENYFKNQIKTMFFVEELLPENDLHVPDEIITNSVAFENHVSDCENQTVLLVEEEVSKNDLSFPIKTFALIKNPEDVEKAYEQLFCPENLSFIDHDDNKEIIQFLFPNISSINHRITLKNFFRLRSDKLIGPGRAKGSLWIG